MFFILCFFKYFAVEGREELLNINMKDVEMESNVDLYQIAKDLEGYSGSDITDVCRFTFIIDYLFRDACMMTMRRKISGLSVNEIKNLASSELDVPVSMNDFHNAISKINKSVTQKDIKRFEKWIEDYGSY